jgi:hypothetical protein
MLPATSLLTLQYESLCGNPEGVMIKVMRFLDLPYEPAQIKPATYSAVTNLMNKSYHRNLEKPISMSSVGSHRSLMTETDRRAFLAEAGECLCKLGYET